MNKKENKNVELFPKWPMHDDDEIAAAVNVLRLGKTNYWTGEECRKFEQEYADSCNTRFAIALANGTVALELALHVLGIGFGDEVIVTPRTFMASASSIVLSGAKPIFADIDSVSQNITAETISKVITPYTKAIIAVHLAGWPCDIDPIKELADRYGIKIIEDCAQAHGAKYKGRPVGSLGDIAAFSFCQDKIITTGGEGGMLVTNSEEIWKRAWSYKDHGKGYDTVYHKTHSVGFRWLHESFGTNWRMTEFQAAIGRIQLKKLDNWLDKRRMNANILNECFRKIPALRVTIPEELFTHSYYKYYVFIRPEMLKAGWNRDQIVTHLNNKGIPCFIGSCSEVYLENAFKDAKLQPVERLKTAQEVGNNSLMFLVHPTLEEKEMKIICEAVEDVFSAVSL